MSSLRIEADYLIETSYDLRAAAAAMAGEQSSGTFVAIPGETSELKARSAATIEMLTEVETVAQPSLPGAGRPSENCRRALVTLSWPVENLGPSLPNLMATVAGNLFELKQFSGLKLLDIRLPSSFADAYHGPAFGVEGTRRLSGVEERPLIGTIIKPSVGLDAEQTSELAATLCDAGIDFIKDDELQSDGPNCPFDERVDAVMRVINAHADRVGRKVMYAFNITGDLDQMRRRHDKVLAAGGTCGMVSLNAIGLAATIDLRRHFQLPMHGHRNGWGAISRHPLLGFSYVAWHKFWRLAGVDHMHVNGLSNKFTEDDDSVIASARACLDPLFDNKPCIAMPVFSSGQTALQAKETFDRLGALDLIYAAGGGIMAHPGGPKEGVQSLLDAWEAAIQGENLSSAAENRPALKAALKAFSK